jgi:hypothetical protein
MDDEMTTTISSQRYTDPKIVAEKLAARDFEVAVVEVEIDSEMYRVIVDGHHSFAAAKAAGVEPEYVPAHPEVRGDVAADPEAYLAEHRIDSDYYDVQTGQEIW